MDLHALASQSYQLYNNKHAVQVTNYIIKLNKVNNHMDIVHAFAVIQNNLHKELEQQKEDKAFM